MDYAERKKRSRRNGCSRNRRLRGGAYTAAYTFTGPISPEAYYANRVTPITDCGNQPRAPVNPGPAGLPGMAGGKLVPPFDPHVLGGGKRRNRSRKHRRNNAGPLSLNVQGVYSNQPATSTQNTIPVANNEVLAPLNQKMVGGRWGLENPQVVGDAGIALTGRDHLPCEASRANPNPNVQMGGVGGPDSMFYQVPTAGYTNVPSDRLGGASGTLYDGKTPFLVQVPYEARTLNPACATVGGRRKTRKHRRNSRRKIRRSNRKSRRN